MKTRILLLLIFSTIVTLSFTFSTKKVDTKEQVATENIKVAEPSGGSSSEIF